MSTVNQQEWIDPAATTLLRSDGQPLKINLEKLIPGDTEHVKNERARIQAYHDAVVAQQSPLGALGLPELLDRRRIEFGIIDGAFDIQCAFDAVYVFQPEAEETVGEGKIIMAEVSRTRERQSSPRAIVIGAGLKALDELYSNGIELGHMVSITKFAPFRQKIGEVLGRPEYCLMIRPGDITGSMDTRRLIREGKLRIVLDENGNHVYEHCTSALRNTWSRRPLPLTPWMSEDQ